MIKKLILVIGLATLTSSRLFLKKDVQSNTTFAQADEIKVETLCSVVKAKDLSSEFADTQVVYSGYLNAFESTSSSLGYIFYGSQKAASPAELANYPTVIWLNGGPGSSSQLGNFLELGPVIIQANGSKTLNKYSWNVEYNVMFVDQPIGVGFGYAAKNEDIPVNQDQVGQHFLYALLQFLQSDKGCVKSQNLVGLEKSPWFLFGESYAGKYVPSITQAILLHNKVEGAFQIPLKGSGIGDPFTDPSVVMAEMPSFSFNLALIDYQERQSVESDGLKGLYRIKNGKWLDAQQSFDDVADACVTQGGNVNIYNIFVFGNYSARENPVLAYLENDATKKIFNFSTAIPYSLSNDHVYKALSVDFMKTDPVQRLEFVLESGLPFMVYNGQNDLIVPTPATSRMVHALNHPHAELFRNKTFDVWTLNDKVVGYKKQGGNLFYRTVNQAGHLVPMDQPEAALDLIKSFVEAHK